MCLGEVFHWIEARQKLLTVSQSALSWVHRRCPQVTQSVIYIVEPCLDSPSKCSYALRCMLITSGPNDQSHTSKLLTREDNIFRDYLFQCVDDSEPVVANAYGQHHLAYPIRDRTGCAVAVLDLYMPPTQNLRPSQLKEVAKVLKLLTLAYNQLSQVPERAPDASDLSSESACAVIHCTKLKPLFSTLLSGACLVFQRAAYTCTYLLVTLSQLHSCTDG